jgi:hypothetical protein
MTDTTPKSRLEGQRGYTVRTRSWSVIAEPYHDVPTFAPMLRLVDRFGFMGEHIRRVMMDPWPNHIAGAAPGWKFQIPPEYMELGSDEGF